ncbi:MAG: YkgJ family cysteine cluster protein [Nitrospinae bacterium]|nr:YkgJ family cysteine cluster protein [Nitrospinota bacterium]
METDEGEQYFKNLPCSFLKDNKCTIYEDRPDDCREFPPIRDRLMSGRASY